jgi:hypothetical protein
MEAFVRGGPLKKRKLFLRGVIALLLAACIAPMLRAWEREPLSVFAERRAKLIATLNAPVVLFGYTGHEEANPSYVFMQEENFYYLTGHIEEGAALLLVPESATEKGWSGAREILYLPPRDLAEKNGTGRVLGRTIRAYRRRPGSRASSLLTSCTKRWPRWRKIIRKCIPSCRVRMTMVFLTPRIGPSG